MKHFLFLDDNPARHDQFIDFTEAIVGQDKWEGSVRHVYSYDGAIKAFNENKTWEIVFLDHDLGEEDQMCTPGVDNKLKTGTDLANYMDTADIDIKLIVLHSFNPVGRRKMSQILQRKYDKIYEIPFGFPYPKIVIDYFK